jgi:hypothetical protein
VTGSVSGDQVTPVPSHFTPEQRPPTSREVPAHSGRLASSLAGKCPPTSSGGETNGSSARVTCPLPFVVLRRQLKSTPVLPVADGDVTQDPGLPVRPARGSPCGLRPNSCGVGRGAAIMSSCRRGWLRVTSD